jgi:hypothetical protein
MVQSAQKQAMIRRIFDQCLTLIVVLITTSIGCGFVVVQKHAK